MVPRVLILEDETVLRASMARGLAKLPAQVDEAGTLAEAIALLDRALPDVIVSDLDLPDGSGIELIGELGRRKARVPVVFVSAYLRAFRAQIPPHADVEVREKPLSLDELRAVVRERVGGCDDGVAPFAVVDYLQLACLGKHSVSIEVTQNGRRRGRVEVVNGEIWHAVDDRGFGVPAFKRLTFGSAAEVACRTLRGAPGERTIEGRWEALLMDSAREHDEAVWTGTEEVDEIDAIGDLDAAIHEFDDEQVAWPPTEPGAPARGGTPLPKAATVAPPPAPPPPPPVDDEFAITRDRAVDALLVRDFATAARLFAIAHALRPDDGGVNANLERLAALGFAGAPETPEKHDA